MKILSAIIVTGRGADDVSLLTDLPSPTPKVEHPGACLCFEFKAERGTGAGYVHYHWPGIPIEIISLEQPWATRYP